VSRYRCRVKRPYFRGDAAFANPEVYEFLEAEGMAMRSGYRPTGSCRTNQPPPQASGGSTAAGGAPLLFRLSLASRLMEQAAPSGGQGRVAPRRAFSYSLSENGLYTLQGWRHFLSALTPNGVFTVSRWFNPNDITETGRLVSLAAAALREEGIEQPRNHLFLAKSERLATLIVARSPLTADELTQLRAQADSLRFDVVISPDQQDGSSVLAQVIEARTHEALAALSARLHRDVSVTTDDRPFFFNQLIALYLLLLPLWFPDAIVAFEGGSLLVRALASLAAIVPSGILMGFGFPTGMRLINAIDSRPTPWFWAVNGACGVLAAGMAVATSVAFSINVNLWVAAGCYMLIAPIGMALSAMSRDLAWSPIPAEITG